MRHEEAARVPDHFEEVETREDLRERLLAKFTEDLDAEIAALPEGHRLRFFYRFEVKPERVSRALRDFVLERARRRCEECGAGGPLHVHHVEHWAVAPARRHDPENLRALCVNCHAAAHPGIASLVRTIGTRRG